MEKNQAENGTRAQPTPLIVSFQIRSKLIASTDEDILVLKVTKTKVRADRNKLVQNRDSPAILTSFVKINFQIPYQILSNDNQPSPFDQ